MGRIRINTNLPPQKLDAIGEGLHKIAKGKREKPIDYENPAEKGLVNFSLNQLAIALLSIQEEFTRVLLKE